MKLSIGGHGYTIKERGEVLTEDGKVLLGLHDDDWMHMQADECNKMIDEAGLDEKFKVLL